MGRPIATATRAFDLDKATKRRLLAAHASGVGVRDLARRFGMSPEYMRQLLRNLGSKRSGAA